MRSGIGAWKKPQIICEGGRGRVDIGARGGRRRRRDDESTTRQGRGLSSSCSGQQMGVRDTWMAVIGSRMNGPVGGPTTSPRWRVGGCWMGRIGLWRWRKV